MKGLKQSLRVRMKEGESFCYTYDWKPKKVRGVASAREYFESIQALRDQNYAKRCECYCDETLTVGKRVFCVFMISFGSFMKAKFHNGENPLARAFGKCLFDEVYLWVEEPLVAHRKLLGRIKELVDKDFRRNAQLLFESFVKLFPDSEDIETLRRYLESDSLQSKGPVNSQPVEEQPNQKGAVEQTQGQGDQKGPEPEGSEPEGSEPNRD